MKSCSLATVGLIAGDDARDAARRPSDDGHHADDGKQRRCPGRRGQADAARDGVQHESLDREMPSIRMMSTSSGTRPG